MTLRSFPATLLCALVLTACSTSQAAGPLGATCDQFRSNPTVEQTAETAAGRDVKVILCSNPSTGYTWEEPQVGDTNVLRLADRSYQAPGDTALPIVGAAGGEILTFHAVAAGATTLSMSYSQPWAGGAKGEWTYRLSVTVR